MTLTSYSSPSGLSVNRLRGRTRPSRRVASLTHLYDCVTVGAVLRKRLEEVRRRIHEAATRCGRDPTTITLVGVTKGVAASAVQEAMALGLTDIGENRVQEARQKQLALQGLRAQGSGLRVPAHSPEPTAQSGFHVRWHLIGHLQRNKADEAVELFHVVHSVDTSALAEALERQAAQFAQGSRFKALGKEAVRPLEVFIQVNVSGEATKFGCTPDEALPLARAVTQLPHLRFRGLMTLAPLSENPKEARPHFRRLRDLRDHLQVELTHGSRVTGHESLVLSMGMSNDFEVAIEEGADLVRIGTAIFTDSDSRSVTSASTGLT